jgi:hypothetical protein
MTIVASNTTDLESVSVIDALWPAPSTPDVGEAVSPSALDGTVTE